MHTSLKAAFEAAYPPQHPNHKDLVTIDFAQLIEHGIGDEMWAKLTLQIDTKISELVCADTFSVQLQGSPPQGFLLEIAPGLSKPPPYPEEKLLGNPAFRSVVRAAQGFEVLKWMFEQRQDILATFVQQIGEPLGAMRPNDVRIRARRD
jgi:hypothetical protein